MTAILPPAERGELTEQLHQAVASFIDDPGAAVAATDALLERTASLLAQTVAERRESLRKEWDGVAETGTATPYERPATEELRAAMRDYRDIVERLLRC